MNATLTTEQRQSAERDARHAIAGAKPTLQDASITHTSVYPRALVALVIVLLCVVLVAAFSVSAMRIYDIAHTTFAHGIAHARSATIAGIAFVVLAETAQVVFLLARSVIARTPTTNALMLCGALAGTLVAAIGNAEAAQLSSAAYAFPWLDAFVPPAVVFITAYTLERLALESIAQRRSAQRAYAEALASWQRAYDTAHEHSDWQRALLRAYHDACSRAFARRKAWRNMDAAARWQTAYRIMHSGDIAQRIIDDAHTAQDVQNVQSHSSAGTHTGEVSVRSVDDTHTAACPHCDWASTYASKRSAQMGLTAHLRKHRKTPDVVKSNGHFEYT